MEWLTNPDRRIPIGGWAKSFFTWLTTNFTGFFDQVSAILAGVVNAILWVCRRRIR